MLQDYKGIVNPPENLAKVNTVALIVWDVFEAKYGWGQAGAIVLLFPLGCAVFCGLHCATSAARYTPPCACRSVCGKHQCDSCMQLENMLKADHKTAAQHMHTRASLYNNQN